jgi:uncharacterized membrane protein
MQAPFGSLEALHYIYQMVKQIALYFLIATYFAAGINHFWHPKFYTKIVPPYVGDADLVNIAAGIAELILAIMMIFPQTRMLGGFLIVVMLLAFVPAHIYSFKVFPENQWALWLRLAVHPLLIAWAWWVRC